jgi:hypothetical protein
VFNRRLRQRQYAINVSIIVSDSCNNVDGAMPVSTANEQINQ